MSHFVEEINATAYFDGIRKGKLTTAKTEGVIGVYFLILVGIFLLFKFPTNIFMGILIGAGINNIANAIILWSIWHKI